MTDRTEVYNTNQSGSGGSGLYTRLVSQWLFPLHERLKQHSTVAVRKQMEASQWWPAAQLADYQARRLADFIAACYRDVPYYRQLFDAQAIQPSAIRTPADLARIPLLTKSLIRAHTEALKSDRAQRLARFTTGGSSGEPLVFYIGAERVSHDVAAKWRATRWWDVDIGDRELVLWGSPIELSSQDRLRQLRDLLFRSKMLPAFEMSAVKIDAFLAQIRRFKPRMLFGYPSAFSLLAKHAREQGLRLDDLGIRVAFVTSEKLYEHQRELIEQVFGCPVANGYGGRDAGFIAHQCPAGKMHITAEDIIVEIVDAQGQVVPAGQQGEIVTTHLATKDFPFMRYRTGDIGVLSDKACSCGRSLPVLEDLQGRSTDFVVAADGTMMHGLALIYVIRELDSVEQFKIVQQSRNRTEVYLVPNAGFAARDERRIREGFQQRLGAEVEIEIHQVTEIAAEKSGKMRYVVSHA